MALTTAFDNTLAMRLRRPPALEYEAYSQIRVRVPLLRSLWMRQLQDRFEHLSELPKGWDGYNGKAVSFYVASFAANLLERLSNDDLPAPSVVPGSDGSLQIEWHCFGYDIEIDVRAPAEVECYRRSILDGNEEEYQLSTDFTVLQGWINDLYFAKSNNQP